MGPIKYRRGTWYYGVKRKVRGGKRHLQRLQQESQSPAPFFAAALQQYSYYYEKLGLHPWHWHHRQPPQRVRQLAVQYLLTTFLAWQPTLAALAEPCYCAIWLVGPEFAHSSQVVVGMRKLLKKYQNMFGDPNPIGPPLPIEYQQLSGINQLIWHTHPWQTLLDFDDYPNGWPAWALQRPNYFWRSEDNRKYLVVQTGWVWVGQLPVTQQLVSGQLP